MIEVRQTTSFAKWLDELRDTNARLRIVARIRRMELGNPGDVKSVGEGVSEMRITYGPAIGFISYLWEQLSLFCCVAATSHHRAGILRWRNKWRRRFRMVLETTRFDVLDHLKTPEERVAYLEAAFEDGDPSLV